MQYEILSNIEIYRNQCTATYHLLNDEHFDSFNRDMADLAFVACGAIDAPDQIPSGSMKGYGRREHFIGMTLINREIEDRCEHQAKIDDIIDAIIADILKSPN